NVFTLGTSLIDFREHLPHASPVLLARDLDMPDFDGNVGFVADSKRLINRRENAVALAAHMSRVDTPKFCRLAGERDDFFRLRVWSGRIFERGRDSNRSLMHRIAHERLHAFELFGGGLNVGIT